MYLKSIEIHGFKSFANKILFEFHNGITAIVGPNGSGKSNVADAVRWVLGEQRAKQLRGMSMQDIIFSGTEARKPLGYASVSITLDNSDQKLPVSYEEVTVTRRVYRSGESEYLLNGTQVRLKDINELFYDTGIGKEGYSIIGQGQVEQILSGKPEERRELFDEAVGIVKFKRRKQAAQKKLDEEQQNLVRVSDILSELTRQLEPMQRQSETAHTYLQKKEELKKYELNLFLKDTRKLRDENKRLEEVCTDTDTQLQETKRKFDCAKTEYEVLEKQMEKQGLRLQERREQAAADELQRQQQSGQIDLLNEQIKTAKTREEQLGRQLEALRDGQKERNEKIREEKEKLESSCRLLRESEEKQQKAQEEKSRIQTEIAACTQSIESGRNEIMQLLSGRASLKAGVQRYHTMMEQAEIRKAQILQEIIKRKSEEAVLKEAAAALEKESGQIQEKIEAFNQKSEETGAILQEIQEKLTQCNQETEKEQMEYHRDNSRLESLKNIAERYDGYGNSIRRVMEQKKRVPGILGVVADLIKTGKDYETAIETALGGSIQNIVTDREETAKQMIAYLKKNKYGRATFLPLTGISGRRLPEEAKILREPGVIGIADRLVKAEEQYARLVGYLLGKTVVAETIDDAIALARKYHHTLRIVTREGELLSPGGSMTGGAFRSSSNLLGRRREIEELQKEVTQREGRLALLQNRIEMLRQQRNSLRDELVRLKDSLQEEYLKQNTVKMKLQEQRNKTDQTITGYENLRQESAQIETQIRTIRASREEEEASLLRSEELETQKKEKIQTQEQLLAQKKEQEQNILGRLEQETLAVSKYRQQQDFILENERRLMQEEEHCEKEEERLLEEIRISALEGRQKQEQIREIGTAMEQLGEELEKVRREIEELNGRSTEDARKQKQFFANREALSEQITLLDRESFRLHSQKEKKEEQLLQLSNYIWEEYEFTYRLAMEWQDEALGEAEELRRQITMLKAQIKALGPVNVNAIEEFRELQERHGFLAGQHEDIKKAEEALQLIIKELDEGMRRQFREEFGKIQKEFDKTFQQLFGGGKGTLELVEEADILEAGIKIVAQPPGKKLQNMMQMSGGEKSLTAIALLFAIQNLKPSPFCLLDEIEAALDESNVDRYAGYLHKLTKHTQFIIITHRRGTMTAADRLYGITMQEKGVSALISVNLIEQELDQ